MSLYNQVCNQEHTIVHLQTDHQECGNGCHDPFRDDDDGAPPIAPLCQALLSPGAVLRT